MNMHRLSGLLFLALGLIAAQFATAQNAIESFNVTQQSGQIVVRVGLKSPLAAAPASFSVANPARIAFDFFKTANHLGRSGQEIGEGELRSMSLVQVGDRTRMVFNLRAMMQYDAKIDGPNE